MALIWISIGTHMNKSWPWQRHTGNQESQKGDSFWGSPFWEESQKESPFWESPFWQGKKNTNKWLLFKFEFALAIGGSTLGRWWWVWLSPSIGTWSRFDVWFQRPHSYMTTWIGRPGRGIHRTYMGAGKLWLRVGSRPVLDARCW